MNHNDFVTGGCIAVSKKARRIMVKRRLAIVRFLLSQDRDQKNIVKVGKSKYTLKHISEEDFVRELDLMEKDQLIRCSSPVFNPSADLTNWREIVLLPPIFQYEKDMKDKKQEVSRKQFQTIREWLALAISIVALAVSIYSIWLQHDRQQADEGQEEISSEYPIHD